MTVKITYKLQIVANFILVKTCKQAKQHALNQIESSLYTYFYLYKVLYSM